MAEIPDWRSEINAEIRAITGIPQPDSFCADYVWALGKWEEGRGEPLPFYRDADDIVAAGIAADIAAGRCWACRCEPGQPHTHNCPETQPDV